METNLHDLMWLVRQRLWVTWQARLCFRMARYLILPLYVLRLNSYNRDYLMPIIWLWITRRLRIWLNRWKSNDWPSRNLKINYHRLLPIRRRSQNKHRWCTMRRLMQIMKTKSKRLSKHSRRSKQNSNSRIPSSGKQKTISGRSTMTRI